jgi:signal transduction histidine kinase
LRRIDVADAIDTAVELVQPSFERRWIDWEVHTPRPLYVRANADHVAQVLANLLQNATRYTPERGRIAVTASARTHDVLVNVTTSGDGIPAADLPHVFERFFRVERSRDRERGGAGIGLAIVKQLVELGGGRVGAESSPGATRFWFSLPGA